MIIVDDAHTAPAVTDADTRVGGVMAERSLAALLVFFVTIGCADPNPGDTGSSDDDRFPQVIAVQVSRGAGDGMRFDVTISSPYDSPTRYADAWRVVGPDGAVHGVRELLHDHASEQPFTRSLDGVMIPDDVRVVTVEARDLVNGWGGATVTVDVAVASE